MVAVQSGATYAGAIGSVVLAVVYAFVIFVAVARMNPDYFIRNGSPLSAARQRRPHMWLLVGIIKNTIGIVLLLLGGAMLVLPGQGILTILIAIGLLDFPGKSRLERYIVLRPSIRRMMTGFDRGPAAKPLNLPEP
ncbi:MAG: hypothetical protein CM1200mP20_14830 [Pseudomonadota bacterium]|nr:MAG: hypothetical protein CM1200mP20_14830 [Pseudomonadota bacterium]